MHSYDPLAPRNIHYGITRGAEFPVQDGCHFKGPWIEKDVVWPEVAMGQDVLPDCALGKYGRDVNTV